MILISEYRNLMSQAFNLTNFKLNGKIDLETEEDKQKRLLKDLKEKRPDLV